MKNFVYFCICALFIIGVFSSSVQAQQITQERQVEPFIKLTVTGNAVVELSQGSPAGVIVDAPEKEQDLVTVTTMKDGAGLKVHAKGGTEALIRITTPELSALSIQDASSVKVKGLFKQENLNIEVRGASSLNMEVEASQLTVDVTGAGVINLQGAVDIMNLNLTGAAHAKLDSLSVTKAVVTASGASNGRLNVTEKIEGKVTGAASIIMVKEPMINELSVSSLATAVKIDVETAGADVQLGDMFKDLKKSKEKKKKFDGHFQGIELGINTYVTRDRKFTLPSESEFMELKIPNSLTVNLNLLEASLPLIKQNFGLVTGLGIEFNNYKFEESFYLEKVEGKVVAVKPIPEIEFEKNKLSCSYLKAPFMFEFQTNQGSMSKRFHFAAGGSLGLRLNSHTKYKYEQNGKTRKEKEYDRFYLNKYRAAGVLRLGWGPINFFAEYNFLPLFEKKRGPELYPVSFGIALSYWD